MKLRNWGILISEGNVFLERGFNYKNEPKI